MAWQPLTFRGVAAFAAAPWSRAILILLVTSILVSSSMVWALNISLIPDFVGALERLPEEGAIDRGALRWPRSLPETLSDGPFLSILVSDGSTPPSLMTDWKLELRPRTFQVCWFFGCLDLVYPAARVIPINKPFLEPWWGAWRPALLWAAGLGFALALLLAGTVLSFIYLWPARLLAFFLDRQLSLAGAWRLSLAAVTPGLLILALASICYATRTAGLIFLLLAVPAYVISGGVYVAGGLIRLPPLHSSPDNPFRPEPN